MVFILIGILYGMYVYYDDISRILTEIAGTQIGTPSTVGFSGCDKIQEIYVTDVDVTENYYRCPNDLYGIIRVNSNGNVVSQDKFSCLDASFINIDSLVNIGVCHFSTSILVSCIEKATFESSSIGGKGRYFDCHNGKYGIIITDFSGKHIGSGKHECKTLFHVANGGTQEQEDLINLFEDIDVCTGHLPKEIP